MNKLKILVFPMLAAVFACSSPQIESLDPDEIKEVMTRVCDLQLENLKNSVIKNEHII